MNNGHEVDQCWSHWDRIKERHNRIKEDKGKGQEVGKSPKSTYFVVARCNIGINQTT